MHLGGGVFPLVFLGNGELGGNGQSQRQSASRSVICRRKRFMPGGVQAAKVLEYYQPEIAEKLLPGRWPPRAIPAPDAAFGAG